MIAVRPDRARSLSNGSGSCIRHRRRRHNRENIHVRTSPHPVLRHRELCRLPCFISLRARFRRQLSRAKVDRRRRPDEFERGHRRRPAAARHICNPAQHYGAPGLQTMVGQDLSGGLPAQHLRAALQPDPSAAVLAVAADPDTRLADRRNCGLVADRRLLARLADRVCLDLHDRSFRSVRPAPGFLRAARGRGTRVNRSGRRCSTKSCGIRSCWAFCSHSGPRPR